MHAHTHGVKQYGLQNKLVTKEIKEGKEKIWRQSKTETHVFKNQQDAAK